MWYQLLLFFFFKREQAENCSAALNYVTHIHVKEEKDQEGGEAKRNFTESCFAAGGFSHDPREPCGAQSRGEAEPGSGPKSGG